MEPNHRNARFLALIPAAGTGSRVGASTPKQYLPIGPRSMLEWTVDAVCTTPWIERVLVVVSTHDQRAETLLAGRRAVEILREGGPTRRDTVLAGLRALMRSGARSHDWILVHDAARPGVSRSMIDRLRSAVGDSPVGGLLGLPIGDTVKQSGEDGGSVAATVDRRQLWVAQTPQMFRLGLLLDSLAAHERVTDEASAIERAGHAPRLVEGARANFKVTTAEDLELMRILLQARPAGTPGNAAAGAFES